jgi:hypothetical protein
MRTNDAICYLKPSFYGEGTSDGQEYADNCFSPKSSCSKSLLRETLPSFPEVSLTISTKEALLPAMPSSTAVSLLLFKTRV